MPIAEKVEQKLKNSHELKDILKSFIVPENCKLLSFDVKSLYTSIPINMAIEAVADAINNDDSILSRTSLSKDDIISLVKNMS